MFGLIKNKANKYIQLDQNKLMDEVLAEPTLDAQMVDLNQKQMYEQGLQADGSETGHYAAKTIAYKLQYGDAKGIPGRIDHITGLDTGITYQSMKVVPQPDGIIITADDRNNFFARINKGLGLTSESKKELLPEIKTSLLQKIRKAISA